MSKYFDTKKGSLESAVLEAVSPAQQAAIAISKKEKEKNEEKVECPKCKGEGCDHCEGKGYHTNEELSAKQKKIDLNKNGKVDGDDLKKLRAKGQKDESVKLQEKPADYLELEFNSSRDAAKAYDYINNKLYTGGHQPFNMQPNEGSSLQFEDMDDADKVMAQLKKARFKFKVYERESVQEETIEEGFSAKEIKMAIGVASDKRYAGGNMTGAVAAIDKIKKGLSDHPQVAAVLKRQNESLAEKAARHISNMWKESASAKDKKEDKKVKEEDEGSETTMTGKPASKIAINPKSKEEK